MSHWWHRDRTGTKEQDARKGNLNASTKQSAAPIDGDSRAPSVASEQEESRRAEDEPQPAARLRGDEREEAPGAGKEAAKQD